MLSSSSSSFVPDDILTDILRECQVALVDRVPEIFMSELLLYDYYSHPYNKIVSYREFLNGKFHDKTSNSDHMYAKRTRFWVQFHQLQTFNSEDIPLTWVVRYHRMILAYMLQHHVEMKNSIWTIYNDIKCMARILHVLGSGDVYLKYNKLMESLNNHMVEVEQWNRLSDRELNRMIEYEKLQDLRIELEEHWRNKMKQLGISKTYREHCNMLLLSMYILAKPQRKEIMTLEIIYNDSQNDGNKDYLLINLTVNQAWYILNKDKKKHNNIVIQLSNKLTSLLIESIQLYPRKYIFTHLHNHHKPAKQSTVCTRLNDMFRGYNKVLGVSSIRASYVSWLFRTNASTATIRQIATEMRTSYYAR